MAKEKGTRGQVRIQLSKEGMEFTKADLDRLKELGFIVRSAKLYPDVGPVEDVICTSCC